MTGIDSRGKEAARPGMLGRSGASRDFADVEANRLRRQSTIANLTQMKDELEGMQLQFRHATTIQEESESGLEDNIDEDSKDDPERRSKFKLKTLREARAHRRKKDSKEQRISSISFGSAGSSSHSNSNSSEKKSKMAKLKLKKAREDLREARKTIKNKSSASSASSQPSEREVVSETEERMRKLLDGAEQREEELKSLLASKDAKCGILKTDLDTARSQTEALQQQVTQLTSQLAETNDRHRSLTESSQKAKKKHKQKEKEFFDTVKKMASKLQDIEMQQSRTRDDADKFKSRSTQMGQLYDDLVARVEILADENGQLTSRIAELETNEAEYKEELLLNRYMREDYDTMQTSMEDAMKLATGMTEHMSKFVNDHKATVADYENKLELLNEELDAMELAQEDVVRELEAIREENEVLRTQFREAESFYKKGSK
mmetsp:Transcript_23651/g.50094  ORF Transcript_23651/g.50094 Transcript_23651/m.50094 type:complete len:433 (+) Transcript_23651:22-1320(+)